MKPAAAKVYEFTRHGFLFICPRIINKTRGLSPSTQTDMTGTEGRPSGGDGGGVGEGAKVEQSDYEHDELSC